MVEIESLWILKDQEIAKWGNKWVKTHRPWEKEKRGYHEFGIWEMTIIE